VAASNRSWQKDQPNQPASSSWSCQLGDKNFKLHEMASQGTGG
jgi:hypothetical protein